MSKDKGTQRLKLFERLDKMVLEVFLQENKRNNKSGVSEVSKAVPRQLEQTFWRFVPEDYFLNETQLEFNRLGFLPISQWMLTNFLKTYRTLSECFNFFTGNLTGFLNNLKRWNIFCGPAHMRPEAELIIFGHPSLVHHSLSLKRLFLMMGAAGQGDTEMEHFVEKSLLRIWRQGKLPVNWLCLVAIFLR